MIEEFSINNYLSIKDTQTLRFKPRKRDLINPMFTGEAAPGVRLLKSAMIYGSNASGKSNILKGLNFLRDIVIKNRKRGDKTGFIPFRFSSETFEKPGEFEIVFYESGEKFRYYVKISEKEIIEEELNYYPGKIPATIYYRKTISEQNMQIDYSLDYGVNKAEAEMIRARVLPNVSVMSTLDEVATRNSILLRAYKWFLHNLKPIIEPDTRLREYSLNLIMKNKRLKENLTLLMKFADFNISEIKAEEEFIEIDKDQITKLRQNMKLPDVILQKIQEEGGVLRRDLGFLHGVKRRNGVENYILEEELESRGTWRYFDLAGPMLEALKGNKILFIDELDCSLHPDILNYLYSMFLVNSQKAQIIITIHNRELLEDKELMRQDSIWFTEKQKDGSTELYSIADIEGIRKDKSYNKLYKSGKFGAIPDLGSLFLNLDYEENEDNKA